MLYTVSSPQSPPKVSSATFPSLSACLSIQHTLLCVPVCIHYVCVWQKVHKDLRASGRKGGRDWPSPLTFLNPPGQEAWRARSDFWSQPFPAAYENKWSKLPSVITRKWLHFATIHFLRITQRVFLNGDHILCDAFIDWKCIQQPAKSMLALAFLTVRECVYSKCNLRLSLSAHSLLLGHSKLHVLHRLRRMGLSNELFLVLISWTWEGCIHTIYPPPPPPSPPHTHIYTHSYEQK